MLKKQKFYKVVNVAYGHHGIYYKVGTFKDPKPIPYERMESCGKGAIYFVAADQLHSWSSKGHHIAWVEPIGKYQMDPDGGKYRAHKIRITKMLPVEDALPLIKGLLPSAFRVFGVDVPREYRFNDRALIQEWMKGGDEDEMMMFAEKSPSNRKLLIKMLRADQYDIGTEDFVVYLAEVGAIDLINDDHITWVARYLTQREFDTLLKHKRIRELIKNML